MSDDVMSNHLDLVLVDLDDTLLPTSSLLEARHSQQPVDLSDVSGYECLRPYDGVLAALSMIAGRFPVGIVTSSPCWYLEQLVSDLLEGFEFAFSVTYDDVDQIKPNSQPLNIAVAKGQVAPAQAMYVGDHLFDQQSAASAGVPFVGAGWSTSPTFDGTALSVPTPQDFAELVLGTVT